MHAGLPLPTSLTYASAAFGPALVLSALRSMDSSSQRGAVGSSGHLPSWCAQDEETTAMLLRLAALVHGSDHMRLQTIGLRQGKALGNAPAEGGEKTHLSHTFSCSAVDGPTKYMSSGPSSHHLNDFWEMLQAHLTSQLRSMSCETFSPGAMTSLLGLAAGETIALGLLLPFDLDA